MTTTTPTITETSTLREVYEILRTTLGDHIDEYFSTMYGYDTPLQSEIERRGFGPLSDTTTVADLRYRWIAVYPVTGGSEGHYVHVDLIWQRHGQEGRVSLFMAKTFQGLEHAITIANILTRALEQAGLV